MSLFQPYLNPKRLLVDPCDRLQFAVFLLLSTILINWSIKALFFYGLSIGLVTYPSHPFLRGALRGGVNGIAIGVLQWPLFRKYVPDIRWVMTVISGYLLIYGGFTAATDFLYQFGQSIMNTQQQGSLAVSLFDLSPQVRFAAQAIAAPLCLVTGLLQYIVLRRYVVSAAWWVVLPLFSYALSLSLTGLYYFGAAYLLRPLRLDILALLDTIDVLVLSISFCSLIWSRGQSENLAEHLPDSFLLSAPEIKGFWATRSLISKLQKRIDEVWKAELSSTEPLTYSLGVNSKGGIIECLPANQASTTFIDQTPLPLLQSADSTQEIQSPLARIQVTFDAVGHLNIRSCRNVSLLEMSSIIMLLGIFISSYRTWLFALMH